jgi:integrase/recombinase XerD
MKKRKMVTHQPVGERKSVKEVHRENTAWLQKHPEVKAWLHGRPSSTQRNFLEKVKSFSEFAKISPEEWRHLDKFEARDLLWKYVEPLKVSQSSRAHLVTAALKSWYRNLNGEQLPFDSGRGGKHQVRVIHKKAAIEHIPNKAEVYRIVDMAGNLRDRALLLTLFQTGMRVNAMSRLTYGLVKPQLNTDLIAFKVTWDIDQKLKGASIPFYYTFLNGEGVITLRQYCEVHHRESNNDTPLFYTKKTKSPINQTWVYRIVKKCVARAGLDPKTIWVHSFRKAFRKIVRQTDLDDEFKEMLMGHSLRGSREAYFDRYDIDFFKVQYQKCNFNRDIPQTVLQKQVNADLEKRDRELAELKQQLARYEEFMRRMGPIIQKLEKETAQK